MATATPMATTSTTAHSMSQRLPRRRRRVAGGGGGAGGSGAAWVPGGRGPGTSGPATTGVVTTGAAVTGPEGAAVTQEVTSPTSRSHSASSELDGGGGSRCSEATTFRGYWTATCYRSPLQLTGSR